MKRRSSALRGRSGERWRSSIHRRVDGGCTASLRVAASTLTTCRGWCAYSRAKWQTLGPTARPNATRRALTRGLDDQRLVEPRFVRFHLAQHGRWEKSALGSRHDADVDEPDVLQQLLHE